MANTSIRIDTVGLGIDWGSNETYRVILDQGFLFQDGNLQLPIGGNLTTFTTAGNPVISSTYPNNGNLSSEENETITIAIDRANIVPISGNIYLYKKATPNVLLATYSLTSGNISANTAKVGIGYYNNSDTITGNIISIPINHYLSSNSSYFIRTTANIVQDLDNHKFEGITSNTIFSWSTSTTWQKDLTAVPVITYGEDTEKIIKSPKIVDDINNIIDYENNTYTFTITSDTNVAIKSLTINGSNWSNNVHSLTGNAGSVNSQLSTLTLIPTDDYIGNIVLNYSLLTPPGNTYTRSQTIICLPTNAETSNLNVARTYPYGTNNVYFNLSFPIQIDDSGVGETDYYQVTLENRNIIGLISGSNPITFSGSKSTVNNSLRNAVLTLPTNFIGNVSLVYTQVRNGIIQTGPTVIDLVQTNVPAQKPSNAAYKIENAFNDTYHINETTSVSLRFSDLNAINYILVAGGGGGGGAGTSDSPIPGGGPQADQFLDISGAGGGAGGVIQGNINIPIGTYTATIGGGGAGGSGGAGGIGGNTTIYNLTAIGGGGGGYSDYKIVYNTNGLTFIAYSPPTSGGSGGGGSAGYGSTFIPSQYNGVIGLGASGISGQGNAGSNGYNAHLGGGGGGAGGGGGFFGGGGSGLTINGNLYAVGGSTGTAPASVLPNTGNGGGGGNGVGFDKRPGDAGASGIIVLTVPKLERLPGAPIIGTNYRISPQTANVSYIAPNNNGGSTIISYTAVSTPGNITATLSTSGNGNITVTGLTSGTRYSFKVYARNAYGYSISSNISNSVGGPDIPTITSITLLSGNTSANISYTAPADDGGSTITSYTAVSNVGGITGTVNQSGNGNITVTGLSSGAVYSFIVYATNSNGNSANSSSSIISVPAGTPSAPTITSITLLSGNTSANISYTASSNNGGNVITSYTAVSNVGNITGTVNQSNSGNILVTGLSSATTYSFIVYATNSNGNGANSSSSIISTPEVPTKLLMHFEGANNSSTFTDSSTNAHTFTRGTSDVYISTADYKFGNSGYYCSANGTNGAGLYINGSRPASLQCQGNVTIEWFAKLNSGGAVQAAFGLGQALFNLTFIRDANVMVVEKSTSGTYASGYKELNYTLPSGCYGNWKHYAFVRNGNAAAFYVDGTACSVASGTQSTFFSDGSPSTGADNGGRTSVAIADNWYNSDYNFRLSYMDEFRLSTVAIYTSNFTPPTAAFTE